MRRVMVCLKHSAQRFWARLSAPVDALPYRVFEVGFVLAFFFRMGRNLINWREWLTDWGFRPTPEEYALMGYPPALPLLEPWMVPLFVVVLFGSGIGVIFNRGRRACLFLLLGCAWYAQGVDFMGSFAYNKIFIAHFALMATAPGLTRGPDGKLMVPTTLPLMIQLSLVTIYLAAGVAKAVNGDWLKYSDVLWTQVQGFHRTDLAAWALRTVPKWAWTVMQHSALAFELLAPMLFFWRRTRLVAVAYGITMHLIIALLMNGLIFFGAQMWSFYALWIPAEAWRRLLPFKLRWKEQGMVVCAPRRALPRSNE